MIQIPMSHQPIAMSTRHPCSSNAMDKTGLRFTYHKLANLRLTGGPPRWDLLILQSLHLHHFPPSKDFQSPEHHQLCKGRTLEDLRFWKKQKKCFPSKWTHWMKTESSIVLGTIILDDEFSRWQISRRMPRQLLYPISSRSPHNVRQCSTSVLILCILCILSFLSFTPASQLASS